MSPPPKVATALEQDAHLTAHRREDKYLVPPELAKAIAAAANRNLRPHRFRGDGANLLPGARHFVTTIYFDTPGRELFVAAQASEQHLKLRAKEYYDLHPDLTETATTVAELVRFQPVVWLEVKHRDAAFTGKQRIGIPKVDVPGFFAEGRLTAAMVQIQEATYGGDATAALQAVARLCATCREPLRADCLVNYRRQAWQDDDGAVRLTIDTGLGFFRPPDDLWARRRALVRESLGPTVATEPRRVLEVKTRGPAPAWLRDTCADLGLAPIGFSKFEAASTAIHG
ncbi:MAG: VTC domain-containing protein [Myxococcales bacterium]|nr:VTC domain-containing protein [Myxococcales bacterium]